MKNGFMYVYIIHMHILMLTLEKRRATGQKSILEKRKIKKKFFQESIFKKNIFFFQKENTIQKRDNFSQKGDTILKKKHTYTLFTKHILNWFVPLEFLIFSRDQSNCHMMNQNNLKEPSSP